MDNYKHESIGPFTVATWRVKGKIAALTTLYGQVSTEKDVWADKTFDDEKEQCCWYAGAVDGLRAVASLWGV